MFALSFIRPGQELSAFILAFRDDEKVRAGRMTD
jgi:hypothetical protein